MESKKWPDCVRRTSYYELLKSREKGAHEG